VADAAKEGKMGTNCRGLSLCACVAPIFPSIFPGLSSCSICANVCVLQDFHTGLVNLAFRKDHGAKKHFSNGTIGNLARKLIIVSLIFKFSVNLS
jgi:hypothetical protein